ncbi:uncharacterized protein LOC135693180 [Rhopilema esculentum]|uniref:uncharacterized protein LOC135693180 n=1 Tax=Rhopilema esculentum TaxID=499914 RepID=UPI0031E04348
MSNVNDPINALYSISSITRLRIITGINAFTCKLLICPKVDLKSTKLEVHLFMKCMEWAKGKFGIALSEVCTDGHVTIASLMAKHPLLDGIFHSKDIWHKTSKKTSKPNEIAKKRAHSKLQPWIPSIRNHFWYCCSHAEGNNLKLRLLWKRLLNHVSNDHQFCEHEEMQEPCGNKEWLEPGGATMKLLCEQVNDPKLLKSLDYYVRNRHTGMLEVFHNVILEYCSKRIG